MSLIACGCTKHVHLVTTPVESGSSFQPSVLFFPHSPVDEKVLQRPVFCSVIAHVVIKSTLIFQETKNIDHEIFSLTEHFPHFLHSFNTLTWFNSNFGSRTAQSCFQSVYRSKVPTPCHHCHPHSQNRQQPFPIAWQKYTSVFGNSKSQTNSQHSSLLLPTFFGPKYLKHDTRSVYKINREKS